jgi:hypothetical protein
MGSPFIVKLLVRPVILKSRQEQLAKKRRNKTKEAIKVSKAPLLRVAATLLPSPKRTNGAKRKRRRMVCRQRQWCSNRRVMAQKQEALM